MEKKERRTILSICVLNDVVVVVVVAVLVESNSTAHKHAQKSVDKVPPHNVLTDSAAAAVHFRPLRSVANKE